MSKIYPFTTTYSKPLSSPQTLKNELPTTVAQMQFIEQSRSEIANILNGSDARQLLIVGPCSIHDIEACEAYAAQLAELTQEVSDTFLIAMRVYFEKPRTRLGWKGIMNDPYLDGSNDIQAGIYLTRKLLVQLAEWKIPTAAEILEPVSAHYFGDLLSWGCIGARTASSQIHRQVASGLSFPVAFKNNTDGNIQVAVDGVKSAATPHSYIGINEEGIAAVNHTKGNPNCHVVLRGGRTGPNYEADSVAYALSLVAKANLPNALLIDCSHDNSGKDHLRQPLVFHHVLEQILEGNNAIRGMILESHLYPGNQSSITDSCMGWETTENLIKEAKKRLQEEVRAAAMVQ